MPVLPAPPCPLSTASEVVTTTPSASFSSKLDKALSVLSPNGGDEDGDADGDALGDDTDEWGVFASYDDDEDQQEDIVEPKYNNFNTKVSLRSSFTKHTTTTNPCFQPRAHLPVFATQAGAE